MGALEAALVAIIPGLAKLLESALADTYDQQAELQAMLHIQRSLANERVRRAISEAPHGLVPA